MLSWALNKVNGILSPTAAQSAKDSHKDIYGRVVERGDDFFHPKTFRGIPVFDVDSIYRHYQPQMDKIRKHFDIGMQRKTPQGESLYKVIVEDIVKRYIEFCHMIPASEDHHHSHTGGLLLHSLEASVESLRWAKEKDPRITGYVDIDAQVKPVMVYCAWLAALLHDAGKMMRDISVDAVEVLDQHNQLVKPQQPIVSWHPARDSLIEWAKQHRVASYSVNFLKGRVHRRHNIDSSQILQPLLRGQYAMEYLLSTPINQQVYNDITRVLSGYTTSDDFLSESVRMGDSASTSRSLGYFYDSRLGSREISTAQRLFKTIQSAATEWEWNRGDGQGWVIANDVFIRWTSSIDHIQKVSLELGYSLPTDVKNILNIMDSNLITDLFDRSFPDDRIVRFTPGKFNKEALQEIRDGKLVPIWHHLLKLRGPQIIFSEAPMPYSQAGIIYLPQSDRYYLIDNTGETISTLSACKQISSNESSHVPKVETLTIDAPVEAQKDEIKPAKGRHATSTPDDTDTFDAPIVMPGKSKSNKSLNGIKFKQTDNDANEDTKCINENKNTSKKKEAKSSDKSVKSKASSSNNGDNQSKDSPSKITSPSSKLKISHSLSTALSSNIRTSHEGDLVLLYLGDLEAATKLSSRTILSQLEKASEIFIDMSRPNRKTWTITDEHGAKHKCVKLNAHASSCFDNKQSDPKPDTISSSQCGSSIKTEPPTEPVSQQPSNQIDMLTTLEPSEPLHELLLFEADTHSLVRFLHNCGELNAITAQANGNCLLDHKSFSLKAKSTICMTRFRNYMRGKGFELTAKGYRLAVPQLKHILISEVSKDG